MTSTSPYFTDRSRMLQHQRCPRARFLGYEFDGSGIEPRRVALPLATGGAAHEGLAQLVQGGSVESGVAAGQEFLRKVATERGFQLEELEDESTTFAEQLALTEALVRLASLRVLPHLRSLGLVPVVEWTEREITRELAPGVTLMARTDGLLQSPGVDGLPPQHYVLSWKTAAQYDARKDTDARVDMQGLSEAWAVEGTLGEPVAGVQMVYLIKGRRLPDKRQPGLWVQHSPLVRGWKLNDGFQVKYAWSYEWTEEDPETGGQISRRLGKGWRPFSVWQEMGVASWMSMLAAGAVQPEAGGCLERQFIVPPPYYRQDKDITRWRRSVAKQEQSVVSTGVRQTPGLVVLQDQALDETFPMYSHSCAYPSRCAMNDICWGPPAIAEDPLGSGLYRRRVPNHPTERGVPVVLPEAA